MRQDLSPICTIHSVQELVFEYASFFDGDGFCKNLFFLFQWFCLSPLESLLGARIATSFSLCNHFKLRIQCCNLSQLWLWHISYMLRKGNHVLEFWNCYILELHQVNLFVSCLNGASFATSCSSKYASFCNGYGFSKNFVLWLFKWPPVVAMTDFHNSRKDRHFSFSLGGLLSVLFHDSL